MENNLEEFDAFEISPVAYDDESKDSLSRCDENDPDIATWSVYGHLHTGEVSCIADCTSKAVAEILGEALTNKFRVELHKFY